MSLSRAAMLPLRLRASQLLVRPELQKQLILASRMASNLAATPVIPAGYKPGAPFGGHALHFKLERYFAAGLVPLLPAAYFIHGSTMDWILTVALSLHIHWGVIGVVNDYARPIVIGTTAAKAAIPAAYVLTILLFAGLAHFNLNDVGLTKAFELVFAL